LSKYFLAVMSLLMVCSPTLAGQLSPDSIYTCLAGNASDLLLADAQSNYEFSEKGAFRSPAHAQKLIDSVKDKLPETKIRLLKLNAQGIDISYPLVTLTTIEEFVGFVQRDIRDGQIVRAIDQAKEISSMMSRLDRQLQDAAEDRLRFPDVPKWTGKQRPVVKGSSFIAPTLSGMGSKTVTRPIFFTGYGHFSQARNDIEKFPGYGINIIQLEIGPNSIFPSGEIPDTERVGPIIDALRRGEKSGVAINLLISPHYMPKWVLEKHPELRVKRAGFLQFCLHAPSGQKILTDFIDKLMPLIKDSPALHSICLSNEPLNMEKPCKFVVPFWIEWLKNRHGEIATLNRRWGATYESFDKIAVPDPFSPDFASPMGRWIDYVRFNQEFFANWHKMLADAIHRHAPDLPVHAKVMKRTFFSTGKDLAFGIDPYLFGKLSQINGNDSATSYSFGGGSYAHGWIMNALGNDLQLSVKDAPVFNSENHIITDRDLRYVPPEHVRTALWQSAIHGQSATTIWVWERTNDPASDFSGSILHRPLCVEAVGTVNLDLNRAAMEVTALQQAIPDVHLLFSTTALTKDGDDYRNCLFRAHEALSFTGLTIGFVTERQLEDGTAPNFQRLIVPGIKHISDKAYAVLARTQGNMAILGSDEVLMINEYGEKRLERLNIERIPYSSGTAQSIYDLLAPRLKIWGIVPAVTVSDSDGKQVWGVEWKIAKQGREYIVNICNYLNTSVKVKISLAGRQASSVDILKGKPCSSIFELAPLETRLLRIM
jgi:hypothetical protein